MVRLEEKEVLSIGFFLVYFNSKMVRLEVWALILVITSVSEFQFQNGTIRRK